MKRFQSILCASLLSLTMSSAVLAGNISGAPTTDKAGKQEGDPLNLVLNGTEEDLASMAGCGWDQTERLTFGTGWHTFKSFLFGNALMHHDHRAAAV